MEKLKMESKDILNKNIEKVAELFPNVLVEAKDGKKIDFDLLKQELSKDIVEGPRERYHLDFPGKGEAIVESNRKINKTLRPIKEKSVNFDTTKNIYIEGDNLEALKILQESYLGKIKCIYIDPPYNTGNDFVYNDDFSHTAKEELQKEGQLDENGNVMTSKDINNESNGRYHSDWLKMMYPRLKLARNLLSEDGAIFISIDDNEIQNLTEICNEVFGENNWKGTFVWRKTHTQTNIGDFARVKEYILCFGKNLKKCVFNRIDLTNLDEYRYEDENGEKFRRINLIDSTRGRYEYEIKNPKGKTISGKWMKEKIEIERMIKEGEVYWAGDTPYGKNYLRNMIEKGQIANDFLGIEYGTNQRSTMHLDKMMGNKRVFDFSKPVELLSYFIKLGGGINNSIILDFFSGSATTAHAVMKLNAEDGGNRQFIMVQLPEATSEDSEAYKAGYKNICDIGEERIRRAGEKILSEMKKCSHSSPIQIDENGTASIDSKEANKGKIDLDIGFRVYKIDDSNMKDVYYKPDEIDQKSVLDYISNVKEDRTGLDLLTQVMLNLGLTLDLIIEEKTIDKNQYYFVEGNALVACFDNKIDLESLTKALECKPLKIVCKESSFEKDQDKINFNERIKKYSPETEKYIL